MKDIVDVKRMGDQIIVLKFVVEQDTFNVFNAYAPQDGVEEHLKLKSSFGRS
jgi:hypothetical protein